MIKKKKQNYIFAVGKRKTAVARVRLFKGKGESLVNGISIEKFFPYVSDAVVWQKPMKITSTEDRFYVTIKIKGGGKNGQLEAVSFGIAKALAKFDPEKFRIPLKKAGLLTRDARERERRKVGKGGKARREKQSPKR